MDKERIRLLEAVADAALLVSTMVNHPNTGLATWHQTFSRKNGQLITALTALAAHRPTPPTDTVPLRITVYQHRQGERWMADILDETTPPPTATWPLHAIIIARVPAKPPAVPVVEGECG